MKRLNILSIAILAAGLLAAGVGTAQADQCAGAQGVGLGGTVVAGECRISAAVQRTGTYNIDEPLRILGTGSIDARNASGVGITINVCVFPAAAGACDLTIDSPTVAGGGQIRANDVATAGSNASPITLNVSRDVHMLSGSLIQSSNLVTGGSSGNVTITAGRDVVLHNNAGVAPGATISAERSGGAGDTGHGGNIVINAGDTTCGTGVGDIIVEEFSAVTVNAVGPAGDITMHAGRFIRIDGSVTSIATTTIGWGGEITLVACCDLTVSETGRVISQGQDFGADLVHLEACTVEIFGYVASTGVGHALPANHCNAPNRPGKPAFSTACIEVWGGSSVTIDRSGLNNGELDADTGHSPGGSEGNSWIDVLAHGPISITGGTVYAVHADGFGGNDNGGEITVISDAASVSTFGNALQANSTVAGGKGGKVVVLAFSDVLFDGASIQAKGANNGGGGQKGGTIAARGYNGSVTGALPGELNADGGAGQGVPDPGTVTLEACVAVNYTGNSIPPFVLGPNDGTCGGAPPLPEPADLSLPPGDCSATRCGDKPLPPPFCQKAAVQSVLDPVSGRFKGNLGVDIIVRVDLGGIIQAAVDNPLDINNDGYYIIGVAAKPLSQLGGSTVQKVDISANYDKTFALLACSVTLIDPSNADGLPAGLIQASANSPAHVAPASPGNIFVMDLHGSGSEVAGWKIVGDGRYMRNVASNNNVHGMWFLGNGNTMHNGNGNDNSAQGILVQGNSNTVDSSDAFGNAFNGVAVAGASNKILKVDAGDKGKGNGGSGVIVSGNGNTLQEVDAYANSDFGIAVGGDSNKLLKNNLGDRNKGNGLSGLRVIGKTNTIQENTAYANSGTGISVTGSGSNTYTKNTSGDRGDKANGLMGFELSGGGSLTENTAIGNLSDGFRLTTTGFSLTKNVSGGSGSGHPNAGCQYSFSVAGNTLGAGNKTNNLALTNPLLGCK